jgi:hypothetical protein
MRHCLTAAVSAGLPNNDQQYFCPANGSSCYYYVSTSLTFNASRSNCQSRGGYLVAYNTGVALDGRALDGVVASTASWLSASLQSTCHLCSECACVVATACLAQFVGPALM